MTAWTQLSSSPRIALFRWKSVVDHVDHAAPRAPGRWTMARPRKGTMRSRGRRSSGCPCGEEFEGSLVRLRCCRHRITGGVGEWSGGMAWPEVGVVWRRRVLRGSTAGHERQEQVAQPVMLWVAGARRPEVEEARQPLDGHRTVTIARIVYID